MTNALRLTETDIRDDIAGFARRLQRIQIALIPLAPSGDTPKTIYKRRKQRATLSRELAHVSRLIDMAQKALPGGEWAD